MVEYSVIVPAYRAADVIGACVRALLQQTVERARYEIIVVDDGSPDGTAEAAEAAGADRVVRMAQNGGPAAARNAGVAAASGDVVLFTDADCEPAPDWIAQITAPFADPDVAGAKGVYRTRQTQWIARFTQLEYESKYTRMAGQERIDFIDTYSAAYRRDVFLTNGGFDVIFKTASVEDQEFSFRLARKGYRLVFVPDAAVYHRHNATLRHYGRRKFGIGYWKSLLLRWHPERAVKDSHTPQSLKVQIGLLGLAGLGAVAGFWQPLTWGVALVCLALFFLTAAGFLAHIARRDPVVLVAAPFFLVLRAVALGMGLVAGFLHFSRMSTERKAPISGVNRFLKRTLDVIGSLVGLILTAPLMAILAVAIRLDSPGPALFVQLRAGENGRPFKIIKFRTMVEDAEAQLPDLVDLAALASPAFKLQNDPRVTRVGRFLRRWSLDELPQFWNVLKGEMSLVGPRPEELRVVQLYNDWHRQRLAVKPGMTGPMQINGRGDLDLDARVRLEVDYIQHYSIWKDLAILCRTFGSLFSGRGAY
ncbi:MAG TPA: exopolysaccharide biosynthesis polyprenyl glycosylphosphotransferase [Anaerolineae bacterium]|nr:exopolysaccharide biosynthesis polyprenyl glycosylphosphotransferase [Anaerolineae bacterium]